MRRDEALAVLRECLALLPELSPADSELASQLADTLSALAHQFADAGDSDQAMFAASEAKRLRDELDDGAGS